MTKKADPIKHYRDMSPEITNYSSNNMFVYKIIRRIVKHAPSDCLEGLEEIRILDKDPADLGFACYFKKEKRIELYVDDLIGWQPWLLKKSYVFPYLTIGLTLGHEIDHHVNRASDMSKIKLEQSAENSALKYIYPSFGIFKPIVRFVFFFLRMMKKGSTDRKEGQDGQVST